MSEETKISEQPTITINGNLAERIREEIGENVYLCYQWILHWNRKHPGYAPPA